MYFDSRISKIQKKKNASAWWVGEFNFGSFELLKTKNGSVVVVGSGKVFFLPGQVSSACTNFGLLFHILLLKVTLSQSQYSQ